MRDLTKAEDHGFERLVERVKRLSDILNGSKKIAPSKALVAGDIWLIFRAGMMYCPDELSDKLKQFLVEGILHDANICVTCGDALVKETHQISSSECLKCKVKDATSGQKGTSN